MYIMGYYISAGDFELIGSIICAIFSLPLVIYFIVSGFRETRYIDPWAKEERKAAKREAKAAKRAKRAEMKYWREKEKHF